MARRVPYRAVLGLIVLGAIASAGFSADTPGQQLAESAGRGLVGTPAPQLVFKTIDGKTIDLGSLYGKQAVYLKFWATWCVPCREQMPHFEHTYQTAGPDLAVIAIDIGLGDSLDAIREYQRRLGITMPIVFDQDGHLGAAFNLRVTPQHIVIGRDGRIQYLGHLADKHLDAALLAARGTGIQAQPSTAGAGRGTIDGRRFGVGDRLPAQAIELLGGESFNFREPGAPRPTALVFLSPWCESYLATTRPAVSASCHRVRDQVSALARDRTVQVRWLGIASGLWSTADDLRDYKKDYRVTIPLTLDAPGTLFRAFRVNDVPTVIVADAHGKIVQRIEPGDALGLQQALAGL